MDSLKLEKKNLNLLLRPIVRFCFRMAFPFQLLIEEAKSAYVEVSTEELEKRGEKVNISRLSVLTGIRRREIIRIKNGEVQSNSSMLSIPSRILSIWEQDRRYKNKSGKPKLLSIQADNNEFAKLVRLVSNDVHHGTILFELKRNGSVVETPKGLKLLKAGMVMEKNTGKIYELLGSEIENLIACVHENISNEDGAKNLHGKTEYDNISAEDLDEIKLWFLKEGSKFHLKARNFLAKYDRDINPNRNNDSPRASFSVSTFSNSVSSVK